MKLGEMADLLNGLAATLEPFLGKTAVNDLREVSTCFRRFADDSVASFCKYIAELKDGKPKRKPAPVLPEDRIANLVSRIQHYLEHHTDYDYPAIRQLAAEVGKLTVPGIKAVGERIGCPVSGTKQQMLSRLENWLVDLKFTADRSSFTLSSAGSG